jgi:hypothetical protein
MGECRVLHQSWEKAMKNLHINSEIVPIIYRVRVSSGGELVGASTVQCLPAEIEGKISDVKKALEQHGYTDVTVDHWEA